MRAPGEETCLPSLYLGLGPIDPAKVTPPPVRSYVARERGFALLRAEEGPAYWESPKPAVALQFAMRYVHYVHDCFTILDCMAFNAPICCRMGATKRGYAGGDPWRDHVRGMCVVVVDGLQAQPVDEGNAGTKNQCVREHFSARPGSSPSEPRACTPTWIWSAPSSSSVSTCSMSSLQFRRKQ